MVLFLVDFSKTNGASVAVDSKESNSETGSNSISDNGGIVEGKLDPRISDGIQYSGKSYGGYNTGYAVPSKPSSNYGSAYSASAYSGTGNYGSGSSYAMPASNYGAGTNGAYNTGTSYGSAYNAANQGLYATSYGSGSYGAGSSYTGPSYGVTPS
ncbi:Uncharacterized protein APZ42_003970, partial [Daphnia magna]